jgi:hypothetical protein
MQRPAWRAAVQPSLSVAVTATLHAARNGAQLGVAHSLEPLPKSRWLRFTAAANGVPLGRDFDVRWRVGCGTVR